MLKTPFICNTTLLSIHTLCCECACAIGIQCNKYSICHFLFFLPHPLLATPPSCHTPCLLRLGNISALLRIFSVYESLSLSHIEGLETYNSRFGLLVSTLKKKPYDPLEYRKQDFDIDFHDFKLQLSELEVRVRSLCRQLTASHIAACNTRCAQQLLYHMTI